MVSIYSKIYDLNGFLQLIIEATRTTKQKYVLRLQNFHIRFLQTTKYKVLSIDKKLAYFEFLSDSHCLKFNHADLSLMRIVNYFRRNRVF